MGGGAGILPFADIIRVLDDLEISLQIIAVTGENHRLRRELAKLEATLKNCTLNPLGYIDNIHELMAVADLLLSKPGGMTSAEAIATGLPILIYRPIPGQEEANTSYLVNQR